MSLGIRPVFYRIPAVKPVLRDEERPARRPREDGEEEGASEETEGGAEGAETEGEAPLRRHIDVRV